MIFLHQRDEFDYQIWNFLTRITYLLSISIFCYDSFTVETQIDNYSDYGILKNSVKLFGI